MNLKKTWKRIVCVLRGHKPLLLITAPEGVILGAGAPIKIPLTGHGAVGLIFKVMCIRCEAPLHFRTERYSYGL